MLQQRAENINRLNIRPGHCAELIGTSVPGQTRSYGDVGSTPAVTHGSPWRRSDKKRPPRYVTPRALALPQVCSSAGEHISLRRLKCLVPMEKAPASACCCASARSLPERWPAVPAAGRTFRTVQGRRLRARGVARLLPPCAGPRVRALKSDRECRDIQKGGPT